MPNDLKERGDALENEYFRRQESELLAKMKAKLDAEAHVDLEFDCPKCDGKLVETDFERIKIDVCNKCSGVWFDAGEFVHVAQEEQETGWFGKLFG
ncbi:MAG TPA: zf-TFIIB domain-containing protein [Pyrinomonadaceae bacterium]|nr:zf-TFIIB domain-containing protein [Pyrinomonadaceae bacterium]